MRYKKWIMRMDESPYLMLSLKPGICERKADDRTTDLWRENGSVVQVKLVWFLLRAFDFLSGGADDRGDGIVIR